MTVRWMHGGGTMRRMRVATIALAALATAACDGRKDEFAQAGQLTGGDAYHGQKLAARYGCGSCHSIPGIPGAAATVGPPLTGVGGRGYIAGTLPNTPQNMVDWIYDPPAVSPNTAMPNLGMSRQEARDIAAYVYTLK